MQSCKIAFYLQRDICETSLFEHDYCNHFQFHLNPTSLRWCKYLQRDVSPVSQFEQRVSGPNRRFFCWARCHYHDDEDDRYYFHDDEDDLYHNYSYYEDYYDNYLIHLIHDDINFMTNFKDKLTIFGFAGFVPLLLLPPLLRLRPRTFRSMISPIKYRIIILLPRLINIKILIFVRALTWTACWRRRLWRQLGWRFWISVQNTFDRSQSNPIWMKEFEILRWQLTAITRTMATMMMMLEKETSTNTSSCAPWQWRYDHGHDDDSNHAAEEDVDQPLALVHLANAAIWARRESAAQSEEE